LSAVGKKSSSQSVSEIEPHEHRNRVITGISGLSDVEIRVLGCLLEKQRTTPDAYPLSLNSLRLACNQSTNREPVVEYDEQTIRDGLHRLERRGYVRLASGAGSRAAKYRHLLADVLPLAGAEQAVLCVLMLRGPQTPGELKQRCERMHTFADLAAVHETLAGLIDRGLVARLERRPGHKEERYAQLLGEGEAAGGEKEGRSGGEVHGGAAGALAQPPAGIGSPVAIAEEPAGGQADQLRELAERVQRLEREVAELRSAIRHPVS
jgi:uncharacterized protein YceH (UPF0502 family)